MSVWINPATVPKPDPPDRAFRFTVYASHPAVRGGEQVPIVYDIVLTFAQITADYGDLPPNASAEEVEKYVHDALHDSCPEDWGMAPQIHSVVFVGEEEDEQ